MATKKCISCGHVMNDYDRFCNYCGAKQEEEAVEAPVVQPVEDQPEATVTPAPEVIPTPTPKFAHKLMSSWDGTVLGVLGHSIAASLLSLITFGIGTTWATCYMMRYVIGHACIEGKRLSFDGKGGQLLGRSLLWSLLTLITCGIYGFWVPVKMYKWVTGHISFAE